MDLDDFAKGAVAALLTDQVDAKTGLANRVGAVVAVLALLGAIFLDGFLRGFSIFVLLVALAFLAFVFLSKRFAKVLINRLAPPADLADARLHFEAAVEEAEIPTGPVGFLKLIWRLRKGIGPEVERLGAVVSRLKDNLG